MDAVGFLYVAQDIRDVMPTRAKKRGRGKVKQRSNKRAGKTPATSPPSAEAAPTTTEAEAALAAAESAPMTSESLGFGGKSQWIRAQPTATTEKVRELKARALAEGIEISENLIYSVRKDLRAGAKNGAAPKPSRPTLAVAPVANGQSGGKVAVKPPMVAVKPPVVAVKHPMVEDAVQKKNIRALQAAILMNGITLSERVFAEMKQAYYPEPS